MAYYRDVDNEDYDDRSQTEVYIQLAKERLRRVQFMEAELSKLHKITFMPFRTQLRLANITTELIKRDSRRLQQDLEGLRDLLPLPDQRFLDTLSTELDITCNRIDSDELAIWVPSMTRWYEYLVTRGEHLMALMASVSAAAQTMPEGVVDDVLMREMWAKEHDYQNRFERRDAYFMKAMEIILYADRKLYRVKSEAYVKLRGRVTWAIRNG